MRIFILFVLLLLNSSCLALASEAPTPAQPPFNISVLYHDETDRGPTAKRNSKNIILGKMVEDFYPRYNFFVDQRHLDLIHDSGLYDLVTAERADIISFFQGEDIDFIVVMTVLPNKQNGLVMFSPFTNSLQLKIIDIANNKYLYSGVLSYTSRWASAGGRDKEIHKQIIEQLTKHFPV